MNSFIVFLLNIVALTFLVLAQANLSVQEGFDAVFCYELEGKFYLKHSDNTSKREGWSIKMLTQEARAVEKQKFPESKHSSLAHWHHKLKISESESLRRRRLN
jgi:hypothetical protein